MNAVKKIAIAATLLCAATVANAEGIKIGGKVNYFAIQPTGDGTEDYDFSPVGVGAGVAFEIPLGPVNLNTGLEFFYAKPYVYTLEEDYGIFTVEAEASIVELGLSIPVIVQYPIADAFAGVGIQANIPLSSKITASASVKSGGTTISEYEAPEEDTPNRAAIDLGVAIVAGYNITENISVNAKAVIGLTNFVTDVDAVDPNDPTSTSTTSDKTSYNQYGIGVTYFF